MTFVFLYLFQYWIFAKIRVQQGFFSRNTVILNNISKAVIKSFSYTGVWAMNFPILS